MSSFEERLRYVFRRSLSLVFHWVLRFLPHTHQWDIDMVWHKPPWGGITSVGHGDGRKNGPLVYVCAQGPEGQAGTYPVTLGFLDLVVTLVEAGLSSVTLQARSSPLLPCMRSHTHGHLSPHTEAYTHTHRGGNAKRESLGGGTQRQKGDAVLH
jgi:hypothetical protein